MFRRFLRTASFSFTITAVLTSFTGCDLTTTPDGTVLGATGKVRTVLFGGWVSSYIIGSTPMDRALEADEDPRGILIDAGTEGEENPLADALDFLGRTPEDVVAIFITHGHDDHIGYVNDFPNATVYSFYEEVGLIEGEEGPNRLLPSGAPESTGIQVDETLYDGQIMQIAGITIRPFFIPGHTAGSGAFLADEVLFLGDAASVGSEEELHGANFGFSTDLLQNDVSLIELQAQLDYEQIPVTHIACSHSAPSSEGLTILTRYVDRLKGNPPPETDSE